MFEDQDITADAAQHLSVRSTIVWALLAIMTIAFGLLPAPNPASMAVATYD